MNKAKTSEINIIFFIFSPLSFILFYSREKLLGKSSWLAYISITQPISLGCFIEEKFVNEFLRKI